jgi:hypothetical protein
VFHGLRAPPISIEAYLVRIAKYAKCSPACFVHSMVHMLKLAQQDVSFAPTRLNVHRLLLTGVLISAKFLDDRYFNNAFYAKVGSDGLRAVSAAYIYCSAPTVAARRAHVGTAVHACQLLLLSQFDALQHGLFDVPLHVPLCMCQGTAYIAQRHVLL